MELLIYATLALCSAGFYLITIRAMKRWGDSAHLRRVVSFLSWFPAAAILIATTLFLRIRLSAGEWAYYTGSEGTIAEFSRGIYRPQRHADGFEIHLLVAQTLLFAALLSVVICLPLLLGYSKGKRQVPRQVLIYAASWTALVILRIVDPVGQLEWLLPS
ncbi:MAG: hypothetical protein JKX85_14570 [Phycisphaeraceae bacterium]|nr:hypothetical protein [Phycisphaeraceae bacterium]